MRNQENFEQCKRIAEELREIAAGEVYRCPNCGEEIHRETSDEGENATCPECGEQLEEVTIGDYFDDALDIEYTCDAQKRYKSARVTIAWGGPNVYVDTRKKAVLLYWGTDEEEYPIDYDTCNEIDDYFEDLFNQF